MSSDWLLVGHYCVVPENIHSPSMEGLFRLNLPLPPALWGNSTLVSYFPLKNWAFETPFLLGIFMLTFLGVGMDIFWTYTFSCTAHALMTSLQKQSKKPYYEQLINLNVWCLWAKSQTLALPHWPCYHTVNKRGLGLRPHSCLISYFSSIVREFNGQCTRSGIMNKFKFEP